MNYRTGINPTEHDEDSCGPLTPLEKVFASLVGLAWITLVFSFLGYLWARITA